MAKVFLYGNSFKISQIVYDIRIIFNFSCEEIILLNDIKRSYYTYDNIPIAFFKTPNECIINSDIIIIFKNNQTPLNTVNEIIECSDALNKQYFLFDEANITQTSQYYYDESTRVFSHKPVVLCVSFGKAAQSLTCELMVERIFQNNGIKTFHIFSDKNKNLIELFKTVGILGQNLERIISPADDAPVIIAGIDSDKNPTMLRNYFNFISVVKPDYILFQTDFSYNDIDELKNISKYICDRKLDCWVKTRYFPIEDKEIISHQMIPPVTTSCLDFEDHSIARVIEFDILSKIAYPGGVKNFK